MKKSKITDYRPELSVKENAEINGVTEAAIRYYIKTKGLSRRISTQSDLYKKITAYIRSNPKHKPKDIAESLGIDVRTVRKYMDMKEAPKFKMKKKSADTPKVQHFLSIMDSQIEILKAILKLHIHESTFACDLTAGECGFYRDEIPMPLALFDKYAEEDDDNGVDKFDVFMEGKEIRNDYRHLYSSIVVDLPVSVRSLRSRKQVNDVVEFRDMDDLYCSHQQMLVIANELLKDDGVLVYTTMDIAYRDAKSNDRMIWVSEVVLQMARNLGFELIDKYIYSVPKYAKRFSRRAKITTQVPAHSYFYVFQKKQIVTVSP